jgi:hypothetical protein
MKTVLQMKKWVDIVLRWLIMVAFALFIVLVVAGFLIFEIFEKPMSSHIQSLKDFLIVVGGITVLILAYTGVRRLLLSIGLIKEKSYWLRRLEEDVDKHWFLADPKRQRKDWVWFLLGFGAITLLVAILVWLSM